MIIIYQGKFKDMGDVHTRQIKWKQLAPDYITVYL